MSDARLAALLFAAAVLVRGVSWAGLALFGPDSASFLFMADWMGEGRFHDALATAYHPMYPLLIALAKVATGSSALAGHGVSILLGSAAVVPLFKIAQAVFGRPAAFLSGLFYAFHSPLVEVQSDVMTDGTFMFFFLAALWLTWRMAEEPTPEGGVVLGLTAAAAFLTRPEGMLSIGLAVAWPLVEGLRRGDARVRRVGEVLLTAAVILLLLSPYLFWVKSMRGQWGISFRPSAVSAERAMGLEDAATKGEFAGIGGNPRLYRRYGASLLRLNLYGALFPFHLLGLASLAREKRRAQVFYFLAVLGYLGGVLYTLRKHDAMSDRYLMPPMALLSALAGCGMARAMRWISERRPPAAWQPVACGALALAFLVAPGIRCLGLRDLERRSYPVAARWIRDQGGEARAIPTTVSQVNYLAGCRDLVLPADAAGVKRQIEQSKVRFYLYSERDVRAQAPLIAMLRSCDLLQPPVEIEVPPGTEKLFVQRVR